MKTIQDRNWQEELEPVIRESGRILLSYWGKKLTHMMKGEHGFATEADLASECYLMSQLSKLLPEASIMAEESGKSGSELSEYQWVIDPLDGTTNFAHRLPYFCVSVALCHNQVPIVGAIYQPTCDDFYFAQKGMGATLNGKKITVSGLVDVSKALIACALPYGAHKKFTTLELVQQMVQHVYGVRHNGAAALDMAYVASGRFDGMMLRGLCWWDIAAGAVLIAEAGGEVADFAGAPITPDYSDCLAGGRAVFEGLMSVLGKKSK